MDAIGAASSIATLATVVVGGLWALVDVHALVNNEGLVRHVFRTFDFDLRSLNRGDELVEGDERIGHQTVIPHVLGAVPPDGRLVYGDGATLHTAESLVTVPPA